VISCCFKDGEKCFCNNILDFPDHNFFDPCTSSDVSSCIQVVVGIDNAANEKHVTVYPNPCTDRLTIEGEGIQSTTLYDIMGKRASETTTSKTINMHNHPQGIYMLRIQGDNFITTKQIIKQ